MQGAVEYHGMTLRKKKEYIASRNATQRTTKMGSLALKAGAKNQEVVFESPILWPVI
jgi:hypothetical protein